MVYKPPSRENPEPLILADRELVEYEGFIVDDKMFRMEMIGRGATRRSTGRLHPNFSVTEVSKFFFFKQPDWLRWRMKNHDFILNGEEVGTKRDPVNGHRYFTLADIERMAHALAQRGSLTGAELTTTVIIVRNVAKGYRIIR